VPLRRIVHHADGSAPPAGAGRQSPAYASSAGS
jgi:hypothetical protein